MFVGVHPKDGRIWTDAKCPLPYEVDDVVVEIDPIHIRFALLSTRRTKEAALLGLPPTSLLQVLRPVDQRIRLVTPRRRREWFPPRRRDFSPRLVVPVLPGHRHGLTRLQVPSLHRYLSRRRVEDTGATR